MRRAPCGAIVPWQLAAVGSLALGIGANTTIFSVAREALFSQPSCRDFQSLVQISVGGNTWVPMSQYRFLEDTHAFDGLAGMNIQMVVNWRDGNRSYRLAGTRVTGNFFEVVGIPVAMGRPIERSESNVAVVTHGFWTKHLGGDPNVVGRTLALDGKPYTVVGVLPRDHRMLAGFGFTPDLYLTKDPCEVMLYARLPRGMTRQAAYARLQPICRELDRVYPDVNRKWAKEVRLSAVGGMERLARGGQRRYRWRRSSSCSVVVTAIVVLIACANVSSLLLARAFTRSREFAIRMSLGGSRGRLVRQLLAESLLLALLGTGAGLLLNLWLDQSAERYSYPTPLPIELIDPTGPAAGLLGGAGLCGDVGDRACAGAEGHARRNRRRTQGGRPASRTGGLCAAQRAGGRATGGIHLLLSAGLLFVRNLMYATSFNAGFDTSHTLVATYRTVWVRTRRGNSRHWWILRSIACGRCRGLRRPRRPPPCP